MQNLKEVDEDHLFVPKGIDSLIKSPEVNNNENNSKGAYSNFIQNIRLKSNLIFNETFKANNEIEAIINEKYIKKDSPPCTVQVLRSVGQWSLGLNIVETIVSS